MNHYDIPGVLIVGLLVLCVRAVRSRSFAGVSVVHIARCPAHGLHGERAECFECGEPVERVPMVAVDYFTAAELEWLEAAARGAAGDRIATFERPRPACAHPSPTKGA